MLTACITVISTQNAIPILAHLGVLKQFPAGINIVQGQARDTTAYLSKFNADGRITVIFRATGDGKQIEVVADFTGQQCSTAILTSSIMLHILEKIK